MTILRRMAKLPALSALNPWLLLERQLALRSPSPAAGRLPGGVAATIGRLSLVAAAAASTLPGPFTTRLVRLCLLRRRYCGRLSLLHAS
jgi:hypothetical protein